eukprot:UN33186
MPTPVKACRQDYYFVASQDPLSIHTNLSAQSCHDLCFESAFCVTWSYHIYNTNSSICHLYHDTRSEKDLIKSVHSWSGMYDCVFVEAFHPTQQPAGKGKSFTEDSSNVSIIVVSTIMLFFGCMVCVFRINFLNEPKKENSYDEKNRRVKS